MNIYGVWLLLAPRSIVHARHFFIHPPVNPIVDLDNSRFYLKRKRGLLCRKAGSP